jgi:beta-glucosidase
VPNRLPLLRVSSVTLVMAAALMPALLAQAPHALTSADRQRIDEIIHKMTLDEKLDYIGGTGFAVRAVQRLHVPALEMSDGPVGVRSNPGFPSTTYAGGICLAANWDRELAERVGAGIGRDARAWCRSTP